MLVRSSLTGSPVLRSSHVDPVAMKFEPDLGVAVRDKERLEGCRNWEVQACIHLLQGSIERQCPLCADLAIDISSNDFIEANFILKRRADSI